MIEFKTIADIDAFEKTPLDERHLPESTYEMITRGAAIDPEAAALEFFLQGTEFKNSVGWSYREFLDDINRAANMFHHFGIGKNEVVSMLLPSLPQAHFTIWGAEAAGIVNPINPLLEADQIAEIMIAAGTNVLVTVAPFPKVGFIWEKVEQIRHRVPSLKTILTVDLISFLSGPKKILVRLLTWNERRKIRANGHKILDFDQTLKTFPADRLHFKRKIHTDDTASLFHTGGTTGTPKLARHSHRNEIFDAWSLGQYQNLQAGFVIFCGLPLFHVNAVIVTGLMPFFYGCKVVLGTPAGYRGEGLIENFWKIVEHYKLNTFSGVPTLFSALLNVPVENSDIRSLEYAACGAAPMPVEVFQEFEKRTHVPIVEGYGLTEGTCVSAVNPAKGERRVGSVGFHLPYQPIKTVVLKADKTIARACAVNEIGAVLIQGANIFPGYTDEAYNQTIWVDADDGSGRWLITGDLGRLDKDGYLWLTGREKELIIRGGHNIDPQLIEGPLHEHPAVLLAAAVGRPDAHAGELPVLYVQLEEGAEADAEELLKFARENISERAAIPKEIIIIDEIPLTSVGKIFKPQLVWKEVDKMYRQTVQDVEGIEKVSVATGPDKVHGMRATVKIWIDARGDEEKTKARAQQVLGAFTVPFELLIMRD